MDRNGALAGIIAGSVMIVIWKQLSGGIYDLYEIVPEIVFAAIAIIIASLATEEPDQFVADQFEKYQKILLNWINSKSCKPFVKMDGFFIKSGFTEGGLPGY